MSDQMTLEELKKRGIDGWIIGPYETQELFKRRVEAQNTFFKAHGALESLKQTPVVMRLLQEKFHLEPSWILIEYSNDSLNLWEGAASWTVEGTNWIQLRKAFKKGHFLFHHKEEVILHESIHSLRSAFDEPQFEEIIANAFTRKKWRRFFNPLFATPRQAHLFLITLLFLPFFPYIPLVYFLFCLTRLIKNQMTFKRALAKIGTLFPHVSPYSVIIWLTDKEIKFFSIKDPKEIRAYLQSRKEDLRLRQLMAMLT